MKISQDELVRMITQEVMQQLGVTSNGASGNGAVPPGTPTGPTQAAQRVPPEIVEAVKQQPVIQQLMKTLDATVVQVELLGAGEGD